MAARCCLLSTTAHPQVLAFLLVGVVECSNDPLSPELTPLKSLAVNLATAATGLVAVGLLVWMTRVPWRALLSSRRAFDRRRLAHYAIGAALLVGAGAAVVGAVAPGSTAWTTFAVSGTTIAFLAITLLTTPLQSAGEELIYRAVLLPAAASWVRPIRPALAVGLVVSAVGFAVVRLDGPLAGRLLHRGRRQHRADGDPQRWHGSADRVPRRQQRPVRRAQQRHVRRGGPPPSTAPPTPATCRC